MVGILSSGKCPLIVCSYLLKYLELFIVKFKITLHRLVVKYIKTIFYHKKVAEGPAFEGCGEVPGESCFLAKDSGSCKENFNVRWFFDSEYGGCSRFW